MADQPGAPTDLAVAGSPDAAAPPDGAGSPDGAAPPDAGARPDASAPPDAGALPRHAPATRSETMRAALVATVSTTAFAFTVGVLARDGGLGWAGPTVFSATTYAGASQAAALTALTAGGGIAAAIVGAILINLRYLPIGISVAGVLRGGVVRRFLEAQTVADVNWALAHRGDGVYDRRILLAAGIGMWSFWVIGTVVGLAVGGVIGSPETYGLDGVMPAMFAAVLVPQLRRRRSLAAAGLAAALVLAFVPLVPPGIPVVVGVAACVLGRTVRA